MRTQYCSLFIYVFKSTYFSRYIHIIICHDVICLIFLLLFIMIRVRDRRFFLFHLLYAFQNVLRRRDNQNLVARLTPMDRVQLVRHDCRRWPAGAQSGADVFRFDLIGGHQ